MLVEYGPGGYSPSHTHAKSVFVSATVLEEAIRSQVNDRPLTTYKTEQSWSELPGDRHGGSANASETKPTKLLAVFVVDTNETDDDPIRKLTATMISRWCLTTAVGFDAIPIGVDCEGSVVARAIVRPQAGCAIIDASGAECRGMERIDRLTRRRSEAKMEI